ncbi:MAG: hypothetical protein H7124_14485 [Phycisphaerales bacterium]|nr:hypothetical protein [Hyphomonadaceae bacterium]
MSHWAKSQLRDGAETLEQGARLKQLIEAAEALRAELTPAPQPQNVVSLDDFRHAAH